MASFLKSISLAGSFRKVSLVQDRTLGRFSFSHIAQHGILINTFIRRWRPDITLRYELPNVYIFIFFSYEGQVWPNTDSSMHLKGPESDLQLLLSHVKYRHRNETRQFYIFTDFLFEFKDHEDVSAIVKTVPATKRSIAQVVRRTMNNLGREDKCLVYFGGHMVLDPLPNKNRDGMSASMYLPNDEQIYDYEFRKWIAQARFSTTAIILVIDACHSGGYLGLPHVYHNGKKGEDNAKTESQADCTCQVVEIAATTREQRTFGDRFGDPDSEVVHGALSWHIISYLKANPQPSLQQLAVHLAQTCERTWGTTHQMPVLSSSSKLTWRLSLF